MNWPRLIVFTRYPEPGQCKTRLIPALGAEGAARLQAELGRRVLAWGLDLARRRELVIQVSHAGGTPEQMRSWLGLAPLYRPQASGGLGQRMHEAFVQALAQGAPAAVLVGTDLPGLDSSILGQALDALQEKDLALGPARDGGYYLVGLKRPAPELFVGIPWSTDQVLAQTLARAKALGLSCSLLPELNDLDEPGDLRQLANAPPPPALEIDPTGVSVIIPALNEAANLASAVESARQCPEAEIIVVDGGSDDGTLELARQLEMTALASLPGRARQMNLGAAVARGGLLLFLHADTRLPPGWESEVRRLLDQPGVAAGAFRFALDLPGAAYRALEGLVNWRSRAWQLPYGDQALFMRRDRFMALGGYPEEPIMEDVLLVKALAGQGRIAQASLAVLTSSRRWQRLGLLRTTLVNQGILLGHALGIPPARLARWYRGKT